MRRADEDRAAVRGAARHRRDLFVYGTLMLPAVLALVCGVAQRSVPAVLHGYARYRVRGAAYPALVRESGARTAGRLVRDLDAAQWARLDRFEGDLYERHAVQVHLAGGRSRAAAVYVLRADRAGALAAQRWSPQHFARRHLAAYLHRWSERT